jgi:hypothetical protein
MPMLARLAWEIFANPATSASSEQTFSAAWQIVTESRTLLNTYRVEDLIFCQQNFRRLPSLSWKLDEAALEAEQKKKTWEGKISKTSNNRYVMCIQCATVH